VSVFYTFLLPFLPRNGPYRTLRKTRSRTYTPTIILQGPAATCPALPLSPTFLYPYSFQTLSSQTLRCAVLDVRYPSLSSLICFPTKCGEGSVLIMATIPALNTPFQSTLDAILHFYPLGDQSRHHIDFDIATESTSCTPTATRTAPTPTPAHTYTTHSHCDSISTLDLSRSHSLPPLDLPLPYIYPCAGLNLSPSRFPLPNNNRNTQTQIHRTEPRRAAAATPRHILNARYKMDISPSRNLAAPRASRSGSSPSRSPYHGLTALSPLQGLSPMQSASINLPKTASVVESPKKPQSLGRIPSRRASMVRSAAEWQRDSEMEALAQNQQTGFGQFSKLILYKAPKEDGPGFGKV